MTAAEGIETLGRWGRERVEGLGRSGRFVGDTLVASRDVATWWPEATLHARELGVRSLPISLYIAVFTGIVLSLLASYSFTGAVPLYFVGTLVEKTITMELAPVLTGLALAGTIMFPVVVGVSMVVGVAAGWAASILLLGISSEEFLKGLRLFFDAFDVRYGLVKSATFGTAVTWIGCMQGLAARGGAQGVGRAATSAVVYSAVMILVLDAFWAVVWLLGNKP